ncbi:MAG: cephalosporin hydroxylase [bacterium]|nr:cephalosporin hydroxylase [bacterium]
MSHKKLYSREEFEHLRKESAAAMTMDRELRQDALKVLTKADRYRWIHQTTWFGEPCLNLPQDMFALQEIIFATRPKFIIELGVAWGGSLLFYATLMEILGGERIIGVDTYIPEDLKQRLASFGKLSEKLLLITGSSLAGETLAQIASIVGECREVIVFLDSYHTHAHVLQELQRYSPFIGEGFYIICGDTIIEDIPEQKHRPRPWGHGNNPKTAVNQFLKETDRFEIDTALENKLLFTCNPGGYLRCCKD